MAALLNWLPLLLRRRKREAALRSAATWPLTTARLLTSTVVPKDALAEEGTAFQTSQIESAFTFILNGDYYGGYLRSTPLSDSEAHRLLARLPEDTPVQVRYNSQDPDQTHTLPADNQSTLPFNIWPT